MTLLLLMMLLLMMAMIGALTMFSMVSQWDLTCFLAAPNSNRSQEEKALKMMKDQSLSVSLELFPLPQTYDGEKLWKADTLFEKCEKASFRTLSLSLGPWCLAPPF